MLLPASLACGEGGGGEGRGRGEEKRGREGIKTSIIYEKTIFSMYLKATIKNVY